MSDMNKYYPGLPEPALAHEMWSKAICDRLDELVKLLKAQNATLVGDRAKTVQVEITEPDSEGSKAEAKAEEKSPAKPAPAKTATAAPAKPASATARASTASTAKK